MQNPSGTLLFPQLQGSKFKINEFAEPGHWMIPKQPCLCNKWCHSGNAILTGFYHYYAVSGCFFGTTFLYL